MWCWLDLLKAVDLRGGLGLWLHPISIWQSEVAVTMLHVYSRLTFIMARRLSCISVPCCMQIFTWMAVITEHRSSSREAWGIWFIARYSEGNERHTLVTVINDGRPSSSQLQRHLSALSCSRSKPNGKGRAAGEELWARVFFGEFPWFPLCYFRVISVYWHWNALWILNGVQFVFDCFGKLKWHCYFSKRFLCHCCTVRMSPH